jgi:hypothetical protein
MSMTSKINAALRTNILRSLKIYAKSNKELHKSPVANANYSTSLRSIQEATQKLVAEGSIVAYNGIGGKTYYRLAEGSVTAPLALSAGAI